MYLPDMTRQGATHDQPIEQLHYLASLKPDEVQCRVTGKGLRVIHNPVKTHEVEFFVDESGSYAIELMRQASGSDNDHAYLVIKGADRSTDSLSELIAARGSWNWEL